MDVTNAPDIVSSMPYAVTRPTLPPFTMLPMVAIPLAIAEELGKVDSHQ